ncbi:MAG: S-methyl-5-thioribose-1-phosphate isomerase [Nanoarchaeota archaeon]|nr:S-methyl-5-thioribose-1-phosphate isomerase [Nanoarchaeota archaeon]
MKVKLQDGTEKHYRTVWMKESNVYMIDQRLLPHRFRILRCKTHLDTVEAIKNMAIRGAGAIGAAAGYAMCQAALEARDISNGQSRITESRDWFGHIIIAEKTIKKARPTAQNLFYAVDRVYKAMCGDQDLKRITEQAVKEAEAIADEDAASCKRIGELGNDLIRDGMRILTHCNAGWLAFVDYGSALSPIYAAKEAGKNVFVYADETRPRLQGANLTAWELLNEGIEHRVIPDNVAGALMKQGKIDMVIVGSDRIAANGDVANKIGTYTKAVLAKENSIPFYVAAPTSTIDPACKSGDLIPIEERNEDEVRWIAGVTKSGRRMEVRVTPEGSHALNIAFDVTPAELVAGIITETGIYKAEDIIHALE